MPCLPNFAIKAQILVILDAISSISGRSRFICIFRPSSHILAMEELMTKQELGAMMALGKTAISTLTRRADFPRAIRINSRTLRCEKHAVYQWLEANKLSAHITASGKSPGTRGGHTFTVDGIEFNEVPR